MEIMDQPHTNRSEIISQYFKLQNHKPYIWQISRRIRWQQQEQKILESGGFNSKSEVEQAYLEGSDVSTCQRCGNTDIWHVRNIGESEVAATFCTRCFWRCGDVNILTVLIHRCAEFFIRKD